VARVSEIAAQLEVSQPSVTGALKILTARGWCYTLLTAM